MSVFEEPRKRFGTVYGNKESGREQGWKGWRQGGRNNGRPYPVLRVKQGIIFFLCMLCRKTLYHFT